MALAIQESKLLLGDQWVETGRWKDVRSPFDDSIVGRIPWADAGHAVRAIDAAAAAMTVPLPAYRRAEILDRIAELLARDAEALASTICLESGKPIRGARSEVERSISTYRLSAGEARRLAGEAVPMEGNPADLGKTAFTLRIPVGVVAAITPFNFPLNLVAHKVAPALAAGCAVVLKPADKTPLTALKLAELHLEAGSPPGWLNVIVGPAEEIAGIFVDDARVRLITFTGSSSVGWSLRGRAPAKRVTLELGNSTPAIVEADADLDKAAAKLAATAFAFSGQSCISVQRIYLQREIQDAFLERFLPKVEALALGDPRSESTDVGPLITGAATERVLGLIAAACEAGACVLAGGELEGRSIRPTVLADVPPDHDISCREVFGPVVVVSTYDRLEEAFELANGTPYGLQAAIFTRDIGSVLAAARSLEFGGLMVNETPTYRSDQMPYGGVKASGNTKEGPAHAVREMTEERLVVLAG